MRYLITYLATFVGAMALAELPFIPSPMEGARGDAFAQAGIVAGWAITIALMFIDGARALISNR